MKHKCSFPNCDIEFDRPSKLNNHLKWHLGIKSFACGHENCTKSYSNSSHLQRHIKTAHGVAKQEDVCKKSVFTCSVFGCESTFCTAWGLRRHELHRHGPIASSSRKRKTLPRSPLPSHVSNKKHECNDDQSEQSKPQCITGPPHQLKNKRECCDSNPCEMKLDGKTAFKRQSCQRRCLAKPLPDLTTATNSQCPIYVCGAFQCSKVFRYKRNLRAHFRCDHLNVLFECNWPNCYRRFKYKKSLVQHLQTHEEATLDEANAESDDMVLGVADDRINDVSISDFESKSALSNDKDEEMI